MMGLMECQSMPFNSIIVADSCLNIDMILNGDDQPEPVCQQAGGVYNKAL